MRERTSKPANKIRFGIEPRQLLIILAVVLLIYVVVPQLGTFRSSFAALERVDSKWAALAALFYLLTAPASGVLYRCLSLRHLPYGRTVAVQYGSSFANRLLPAGLGALGVGYFYLRKQRFTEAAALAVVTLNNLLGFAGHAAIIVLLVIFLPGSLTDGLTHLQVDWAVVLATIAGVTSLLLLYLIVSRRVRRLSEIVTRTIKQVASYRRHKRRLLLALFVSMCLTLFYASALWASGQALGADFALPQAVFILAVGVGIGAAVPLPGGIGGAEAGLVAGLLAFGQSPDIAIATAILYRLVTYWLGFAVGAIAFIRCRQQKYF
ncbi:MAG TPA: lysylphosphatidylglycerol synthase transmembrane domain-containing protein [Candidatus Saccharimonadales bacterium]|nr:lysylphosphatidylglycerol synthase transmembrane domain-containing protein [Candidatus Saccharimonadales bacterium]